MHFIGTIVGQFSIKQIAHKLKCTTNAKTTNTKTILKLTITINYLSVKLTYSTD